MQMWVSIASDATCAAALQQAVEDYGVYDTWTLQVVLQHNASGFARALCTALQADSATSRSSEIGTMTDASVVNMGTQATADDAVDTATAEAMVAEALRMVDEAKERERLAEERARSWEDRAELGATLLRAAEARTDRAQAARCTAGGREIGSC